MRAALLSLAFVILGGCATAGDPLPPRASRPGPPESVKDHPGFYNPQLEREREAAPEAKKKNPSPLCERACAQGTHCVVEQGIDRCVADDAQ